VGAEDEVGGSALYWGDGGLEFGFADGWHVSCSSFLHSVMTCCFGGVLTTTWILAVAMAFLDRRFEILFLGHLAFSVSIFYFCVSLGRFWILLVRLFV
jgi:hypothetical protein